MNLVVVGMQWGDEGKGKVVDLLGEAFDVVVRYQGGHNAGHTVRFGEKKFALHLIPSGILRPDKLCVLGNGMVIEPAALLEEMEGLHKNGIETEGKLFISNRAHLILEPHGMLDQALESALGDVKIGTTSRGIGPAYTSKISRFGLRLCDLYGSDLDARLRTILVRLEGELHQLRKGQVGHPSRIADELRIQLDDIRGYIRDTSSLLNGWIAEGKSVLFEGAQGTLLDIDHGTYPFVTSSNCTAGGACTGTGVPPRAIGGVLGILKAYTTRVGGGPFVGELENKDGEELRLRGNEYGTTTGRPRRCGWLDTVAASYSRMINGVDGIALTKLDVLDTLAEIPVCVGYRFKGKLFRDFPAEPEALEMVTPELKVMKGWQKATVGITDYGRLPQEAKDYISLIEDEVRAPVVVVSTGPRREETILRPHAELKRLTSGRLVGLGDVPGGLVAGPPRSTQVKPPPRLEKRGASTEVKPPEGPQDKRKPWERDR